MSTIIRCPNGHAIGITPAMEGSRVQCPICRTIFEVPRSVPAVVMNEDYVAVESIPEAPLAPPLPPQDVAPTYVPIDPPALPRRVRKNDYDEPLRKKKKKGPARGQVRSLDIGLACYYWKFVVSVILILLFITSGVVSVITQAADDPMRPSSSDAMAGFLAFLGLLGLIGFGALLVLGVVGAVFAVRVPSSYGVRGLAIANFALEMLPPLLYLIGVITSLASRSAASGLAMATIIFLLAAAGVLAGFIVFMIFLKALAGYLEDRSTEFEAIQVMVLTLAVVIGAPILLVVAVVTLRRAPILAHIVAFGIVVFAWISLIKLLFRILAIIASIRSRLPA